MTKSGIFLIICSPEPPPIQCRLSASTSWSPEQALFIDLIINISFYFIGCLQKRIDFHWFLELVDRSFRSGECACAKTKWGDQKEDRRRGLRKQIEMATSLKEKPAHCSGRRAIIKATRVDRFFKVGASHILHSLLYPFFNRPQWFRRLRQACGIWQTWYEANVNLKQTQPSVRELFPLAQVIPDDLKRQTTLAEVEMCDLIAKRNLSFSMADVLVPKLHAQTNMHWFQ